MAQRDFDIMNDWISMDLKTRIVDGRNMEKQKHEEVL